MLQFPRLTALVPNVSFDYEQRTVEQKYGVRHCKFVITELNYVNFDLIYCTRPKIRSVHNRRMSKLVPLRIQRYLGIYRGAPLLERLNSVNAAVIVGCFAHGIADTIQARACWFVNEFYDDCECECSRKKRARWS